MSGYLKIVAARKKKAGLKKEPVQKLAFGGLSVPDLPIQNLPLPPMLGGGNAGSAAQGLGNLAGGGPLGNGTLVNTLGAGTVGNPLQRWVTGSGTYPNTQGIGSAFQVTNPNMFQAPTGLVNPTGVYKPVTPDFSSLSTVTPQEQALASQLTQQSIGRGPAQQLLQQQLQQATQQNIAQNAGMIASTRGINPALAARLGGQSAGAMSQQAAGQAANLGLESELGAQQNLGGLLGQLGQQGLGQAQLGAEAALGSQGQNLGAIGAYNTAVTQGQLGAGALNKDVGIANLGAKTGALGGLLNAAGAIGAAGIMGAGGAGAAGAGTGTAAAPGGWAGADAAALPVLAAHGAVVPGKAPYPGDDERNDKVPADLSAGEIVLPRSITQHPDAPWLAAKFVAQVLAGRGPPPQFEGRRKLDDGGLVGPPNPADPEGLNDARAAAQASGADTGKAVWNWLATGRTSGGPPPDSAGATPPASAAAAPFDPTQVPSATAAPNPNYAPLGGGAPGPGGAPAGPDPFAGIIASQNRALDLMEKGAQGIGAAGQAEAAAQGKAFGAYGTQMQGAQQRYQDGLTRLDQENQGLTQAVMNGKIDPTRIWANADTGSRVAAAIGVLLSGIGSGLTGQPNMALGVINKLIDQDIDAQRVELGKKTTLLSMNLQKYGRLDQAYAVTAAQMHAVLEGQLGQAAATGGGLRAGAQAQMAMGQIEMQRAQLQQRAALYKAWNETGAPTSGVNVSRLRLGMYSGIISGEEGKAALKEYGDYTKLHNNMASVGSAFNNVKNLQTVGARLGSPIQSAKQIDATKKIFSAQLAKDLEGRATPQDIDSIMENFPDFADNDSTLAAKRLNLENSIKSKFSFPTLQYLQLVQPRDPLLGPTAELPGDEPVGRQ